MSIQSSNLRMTTLEVLNHQPIRPHHPPLKDGIHLRWNPGVNIDFPWYGYYLLRRKHIPPSEFRCMHLGWIRPNETQIPYLSASVGLAKREYMITEFGNWLSDKRIRITDDFIPQQVGDNARFVEIDLAERNLANFYFNEPVNSVVMTIGFRVDTSVTIEYELFNNTIHTEILEGNANDILNSSFSFDAITSIKFSGADAAVIALCHSPVNQNILKGWEFIDGLKYPICLPVDHPNYPCPNKPNNANTAQNLAIDRVNYGDPNKWLDSDSPGAPTHVERLYELLSNMVMQGPAGTPMHSVSNQFVEDSEPNPGAPESLRMPSQKPMNLIQLGALDPAVAQMTGLYFVDESAEREQAYDYIILADHTGIFKSILEEIGTENGFSSYLKNLRNNINTNNLDGWICFNRQLKPIGKLDAPEELEAYALPGMTVRDELTGLIKNSDKRNSAGLTWNLGLTADALLNPDYAVMYELWRHYYGDEEPSSLLDDNDFALVTKKPFVVVKLDATVEDEQETASNFPPFRLFAYDNYLRDGWYSYKLSGRDLFGRYSELSDAAKWFQWNPAPDPKPHYYIDPPAKRELNTFAIQLLDLTPPPPPTSIEAVALDHEDQFLVKDAAYNQWRNTIENANWFQSLSEEKQANMIGLRVRWQWTNYHMRQAPNAVSFKIHFNPGYEPPANSAEAINWNNFLIEVIYTDNHRETVRVMKDIGGQNLEGTLSEGNAVSIAGNVVVVPLSFDLSVVRQGFEHILLVNGANREIFRIDAVNIATHELSLNGNPSVGPNASWRIGLLLRQYEIFLPSLNGSVFPEGLTILNPGLPSPDNFSPSLEFPKSYANIGVNTVEEKSTRQVEGDVGASAKIFRVRRTKPAPPPALPPDSDKVFASPADYYGNSYYTYRWQPANFLRTHIYRALDESIFICDYFYRPKDEGDADVTVNVGDDNIFPDVASEPLWDNLKRTTIANELNGLNNATRTTANQQEALKVYRLLSNDAMRILAGLPHNKKAFQQITIKPLEDSNPETVNAKGPDNPDGFNIDISLRKYIDTLPGKAANRYFYRAAYVDNAENISGMNLPTVPIYLPDVSTPKKPVITKVTAGEKEIKLQWVSQSGKGLNRFLIYSTTEKNHTRDIRLMGDPVANLPLNCIVVNSNELDLGEETNITQVQKVYSAAAFDPSLDWLNGQSATEFLAAPASPVAGVLTGLTAADGTEVVVVYTDVNGGLQFTACRSLPRCWVHAGLTGGTVYYYRIEVIKTTTIQANTYSIPSKPSAVASAKPYDLTPPAPPIISTIEWVKINEKDEVFAFGDPVPAGEIRFSAVRLIWTSPDPNLKCLIQFQNEAFSPFQNGSGWLKKGVYEFIHRNKLDYLDQEYRIKVINEAGNINQAFSIGNLVGN